MNVWIPYDTKVTAIRVVGGSVTGCALYDRDGVLLGHHPHSGSFATPIPLRMGPVTVVLYRRGKPVDLPAYLEEVEDDVWRMRQAAKAERERMLAQADALDRALWEAGCPS